MLTPRRWDPERIGPYAILGRLGTGAMGEVYLARSTAGRLVAVKVIKPELAEMAGFRTRFAQEVAAARRVSGVFTAPVVEADPDADLPWLATAYIPAPSLRDLVRACGVLPVATVRWLAAGCAEALDSIHTAGLVHMDLKPSNVLVAADGPRVIDFGVARAVSRIGYAAPAGVIGTPAYMAPEQARDTSLASPASDVFSLGATLLYAATGHPPHQGETSTEVLVRLATEPPDLAGLPAELAPLVGACLDRIPRQRPSSAVIVARLGQFAGARAYLPDQAQEMIRQCQRDPAATPGSPRQGEPEHTSDDTAESYPALPAAAWPESEGLPAWVHALRLRRGVVSRRAVLAAGGTLLTMVGLIVVGVLLGTTLIGAGGTVSIGTAANGTPATAAASGGVTGGGGATGAGALQPPAGVPPLGPQCVAPEHGTVLCVNQVQSPVTGPADFTVRGSGFKPGAHVTLTMLYLPPPRGSGGPPATESEGKVTVTAGSGGKFAHVYGPLRPGLYVVSAGHLTVVFRN